MERLVDVDVLLVPQNLVEWVVVGTEAEQRCQASFGPASPLDWCGMGKGAERRCQSVFYDIAGKGPQQIENAAPVACGVTASWEVNIFYVGRRT